MDTRDFIIGSLHGVVPHSLAAMTPSVEPTLPPTLAGVEAVAEPLGRGFRLGNGTVHDVDGLYRILRPTVLAPDSTPAAVAVLMDRVLWGLPRGPAADLALLLTSAIRAEQWARLNRGTILVLRNAVCLASPEENDSALASLDHALEALPAGPLRTMDGTWVVLDGVREEFAGAAEKLARQLTSQDARVGRWIQCVPAVDHAADAALLRAYARVLAHHLAEADAEATFAARDAVLVSEARLEAQALRGVRWNRPLVWLRAAARRMTSAWGRPEPVPLSHF